MISPHWRFALPFVLLLAAALAAPAQAQSRASQLREQAERPLPGRERADPGRVAAADIALARAARDEGQWSAFAQAAAPQAQFHGEDGPYDAARFLLRRANPPTPLRWAPTEVWSSCDGSLAVSFGRFTRPDGVVGSYTTVWQRAGGRDPGYRWLYHTSTPDQPQPIKPAVIMPDPDTIIVTEITSIRARAADCRLPQSDASAMPGDADPLLTGGGSARDGTLRWRWVHGAPGEWRMLVEWVREGAWTEALAFEVPEG